MRYRVSRTSVSRARKPCEEAYSIKVSVCSEFREIPDSPDAKWLEEWTAKGKNHRQKNGYLIRDIEVDHTFWFIDIGDLDDLNAFANKYGDIIIVGDLHEDKNPYPEIEYSGYEIEIYDSYRE